MRIYIAGPMRGLPNWNFEAFDKAEARWRAAGHQPFSPAQTFRALGYNQGDHQDRKHLEHVIQIDLACIYAADGIALLPGWENSVGCTVEVALAQFLSLPIYDAITMVQITERIPTRPWADNERLVLDRYVQEFTCKSCEDEDHGNCKNGCGGVICLCRPCTNERRRVSTSPCDVV